MAIDKAAILGRDTVSGTETITLDGVGEVIVRGLSRAEAIAVQQTDDVARRDVLIAAYGLVEPEMTAEDVAAWQRIPGAGRELEQLTMKVAELSGMLEGQPKEVVKKFRQRPGR